MIIAVSIILGAIGGLQITSGPANGTAGDSSSISLNSELFESLSDDASFAFTTYTDATLFPLMKEQLISPKFTIASAVIGASILVGGDEVTTLLSNATVVLRVESVSVIV